MKRRVLSLTITLALCLNLCPVWGLAAGAGNSGGLCPHHPAHTDECGYLPPALEQQCTHSHNEDCYTAETDCIHQHTAECYPASEETSTEGEPVLCTHMCTEDSGCVTRTLSCPHTHGETCGYVPEDPGAPCTFVCWICPIEDLIGRLPSRISASNSGQVQVQLSEIYDLYEALTSEEQQQVDLSPCAALLDQMEGLEAAVQSGASLDGGIYLLEANQTYTSPYVVSTTKTIDTDKFTLFGTGASAVRVTSTGVLTLKGKVDSQKGVGVEVAGGALIVTDSNTYVKGMTYALDIASGANVQLSAGTYIGKTAVIRVADDDFAALLATGCAYFDNSGHPILPADIESVKELVVGPCTGHENKSYTHNPGATQHTWTCPACGWAESEACTFTFNSTGNGTCICGNSISIIVDESNLADLVYDGTLKPADIDIKVTLTDGSGKVLVKGTDYQVEYEPRKDVGEITVTVTGSTFNGTFTKTYSVSQDRPKLEWDTSGVSVPVEVNYDGSPVEASDLPPVRINIQSSTDNLQEYLRYSYKKSTDSTYTDNLPTDAGRYDVIVSLPEMQNFEAAESAPITLIINKIDPIATPPAAKALTFNRTAQELVTAGELDPVAVRDGVKIKFATSADGLFSTAIPTGTNAGTYEVWYKVEGGNNYNAVVPTKIDVNIQRKPITPVVELSQDKYQYDGDWKVPGVTVKDNDDKTVLKNDEYKVEYVNNQNVSTPDNPAKVVVSDKPGGNYAIKKVEVPFQIAAREQETLSITQKPNTIVYGDQFTLGTSGGSGSGGVTWTITAGTNVATVDPNNGQVTITGCGSATVKVTKSGLGNYEDATDSWPFTAKPKPVTAIVTAQDKTYNGSADAAVTAALQSGDLVGNDRVQITLSGSFEDPDAGTGKRVKVDSTNPQFSGDSKGQANYIITYPAIATASIYKADIAPADVTPPEQEDAAKLEYTGLPLPLIKAGSAAGGTLEYSQDGGITYSESLPTGTAAKGYDIWYRVKGDRNHNDIAGQPLGTVTISRQEVTSPIIELTPSNSASYDGQVHQPSVTVKDKYHRVIPVEEYTVTYDGSTDWIKVGDHTVTITGNRGGNYDITTKSAVFKILPSGQTPLSIVNQPGGVQYGDTFTLSATGGSSTSAVKWESSDTNIATIDNSGNVEVKGTGPVTITATRPADGNYSEVSATWSFNAEKKPVTAIVTADNKVFNNSNSATLHVDWKAGDLLTGDSIDLDAILSGRFDDSDVGDNKTVRITDNGTSPGGNNSANYTISYNKTTTASITPAPASVTGVAGQTGLTYDGSAHALVSGGTVTGGTLAYSRDGVHYELIVPAETNAGTYSIWYKVLADKNHEDSTAVKVDVTIAPKSVTPAIELSPTKFEYDGTPKKPDIVVKDSSTVIPPSEYTVTFTPDGNPIEAKEYTVTVTDKSGGNYKFDTPVTGTFQIIEATQNPLSIVTDRPTDLYYGDTFRLTATGGFGSGAIQWSIAESGVAEIASVNGNNCVVTVKGTGDFTVKAYREAADGYGQSNTDSVSFTAHPKPVTPEVTADDKVYDGTTDAPLHASWKSGDLVGTDAVTLTVSGEFATADVGTDKQVTITSRNAAGTNADKYAIHWPDSATASILRGEAKLDPSNSPTAAGLTYTGTSQPLLSSGGSTVNNVGTIEYSLSQDSGYSTAIPTAVNAGTHTVWYKVADHENYQGFGPMSIEVEIKKADPTITPPTVSGTEGQSLSEMNDLSGFTATLNGVNVDGSFAWKDGTIKPGAGTSQQDVVFTPDDTANYNTLTFQVQVTVAAPSSPDSGGGDGGSSDDSSSSDPTDSSAMQTTIQDGTAETVVSDAAVNELVQQAAANQSKSIVIKPEITGDVTKTQVSIPATTVSQIKSQTNADLTVSTPVADVTIPSAALEALSGAGGTVDVTAEQVGQTVVLTLTAGGEKVENIPGGVTFSVPAENTQPGTVAVLVHEDGTRQVVRKSVAGEGKVNVPLDGSATIEIVEDNSKDFSDVSAGSWAADAVAFASAHELFNGTSETTFSPNRAMSRGMLTTVLYNLEGRPKQEQTGNFSDVSSGAWYADSITWAAENGIADGDESGQFGPNNSLTREEVIVMLWKYAGSPQPSSQTLDFADADQASSSAQEALCWAAENGIVKGYANGQLAPKGTATRAQAAQMLKNLMERT